ncbi:hypothetical protein K491DRAFT_675631 [Lophiostoma macrostomum CBS 122681]|uniref:Uncharacterized protein n=1 Tax=Lophiostoma macrostomum CBS 122681 TaxID=1314788 RepID=A0A6A6TJL8_9PLEO|nr:hypothetical protein K491DRAFT_675631 [Lophiostoma macrostomum CBS 122681]
MKFFAVAVAAFAATAAALQVRGDEACSIVTITETVTVGHTPSAPGSAAPTIPPYPTSSAPYPTVAPTGTAAPTVPAPSGTGAYTAPPPEFTGAASNVQVGLLAGAGALAAFFL